MARLFWPLKKRDAMVLMIGIKHFADINDVYGYPFGNKVLKELAQQLRSFCKGKGMLYRMDGAKFAFCASDISRDEMAEMYSIPAEQVKAAVPAEELLEIEYRNELKKQGVIKLRQTLTFGGSEMSVDPLPKIATQFLGTLGRREHGSVVGVPRSEFAELWGFP